MASLMQTAWFLEFCSIYLYCSCSDTYEHHYSNKRQCGRAMRRRQCRSHIYNNPNPRDHTFVLSREGVHLVVPDQMMGKAALEELVLRLTGGRQQGQPHDGQGAI